MNIGIVVGLFFLALIAWAVVAGPLGIERGTYSLIMRWVNFGILALVIVKYGRKPISNFLKSQGDEVADALQELEDAKRSAEEKISEGESQLKAGQERLAQIKERILADGERRKEELIANAQRDGAILLDSAKLKIEAQMREARQGIRAELIDMASDIASNKLPQLLTPKDQNQLVERWMEAAQ